MGMLVNDLLIELATSACCQPNSCYKEVKTRNAKLASTLRNTPLLVSKIFFGYLHYRQANYLDSRPNVSLQVIIGWNQAETAIGLDDIDELDWKALGSTYWANHAFRYEVRV